MDGGAVKIAVDPAGNPWVVNDAGQVFKRLGGRWVLIAGISGRDISIGANGAVWVLSRDPAPGGYAIMNYNPITNTWRTVGGGGIKISVAPNGMPFVINSSKNIFEYQSNSAWVVKPGAANDIAIGANGKMWVIGNNSIGADFDIHQWMGTEWSSIDGGGVHIAVDNQGYPWLVNSNHEIYRRVFTVPAYSTVPTAERINMNHLFTGKISAVAINPNNNNHIIVSGETGGLFETLNGGSSSRVWSEISVFNHHSITDVLILPQGSNYEIWVTTIKSFENSTSPQIWKRSTLGVWSRATTASTVAFSASNTFRVIKSKTSDKLYAYGPYGIAVKNVGSDNWIIKPVPVGTITSLETLQNGNIAAITSMGFYYSVNDGDTWITAVSTGFALPSIPDPYGNRFTLKSDLAGNILLASQNIDGQTQVYASIDFGDSWIKAPSLAGRYPPGYGGGGGYNSIQPYYDATSGTLEVYISNTLNSYYSFVRGSTPFIAVNNLFASGFPTDYNAGFGFNALHPDTRQIFKLSQGLTEPKLIVTSDGGFSSAGISPTSRPDSYSWAIDNHSSGLHTLQMYNITGTDTEIYFGTQDCTYGYNNNRTSGTWVDGGGTEGFFVKKNGNGFYDNITLKGLDSRVGKVTNGWTLVTACVLPGSADYWNSPLANYSRPVNYCKDVYIQDSSTNVWKITYDKGCTWETLASSYRTSSSGHQNSAKAYFSFNTNRNPVLTATFELEGRTIIGNLDDVLTRKSRGRFWHYATMTGHLGIASLAIQFIRIPLYAVDAKNSNNAISVEVNTGILKMTTTTGNLWNDVTSFTNAYSESGRYSLTSSEGNLAITFVEISPFDPSVFLVGTSERGIFILKNSGTTWQRITSSRNLFQPTDAHWISAKELFVSTYGTGLFRLRI